MRLDSQEELGSGVWLVFRGRSVSVPPVFHWCSVGAAAAAAAVAAAAPAPTSLPRGKEAAGITSLLFNAAVITGAAGN